LRVAEGRSVVLVNV